MIALLKPSQLAKPKHHVEWTTSRRVAYPRTAPAVPTKTDEANDPYDTHGRFMQQR